MMRKPARRPLYPKGAFTGTLSVLLVSILVAVAVAPQAGAGWLSRLARDVGDAGSSIGSKTLGQFDEAGRYLSKLPSVKGEATLIARRDPSGHWVFANRKGETFTASNPKEMARVAAALAPAAAAGDARLVIALTEDAAIAAARSGDVLPDARLRVVVDRQSYPLDLDPATTAGGSARRATVKVRRNVEVPLTDKDALREAMFHLERRLSSDRVRVLALHDDGPKTLGARARLDPATRLFEPDRISPEAAASAIRSVRGQTVILTGRVDGRRLVYRTASGAERDLDLAELKRAAADADVDLLVLNSRAPRQPGSRNWLWQRATVDGLDDALKRQTFADFLDALGEAQGGLTVTASRSAEGRVAIRAVPLATNAPPTTTSTITDTFGTIIAEVASEAAGRVLTIGIEGDVKTRERQEELDLRLIPGIPSAIQFAYLLAVIAGFAGFAVARGWWFRLWPPEQRSDYASAIGYQLARLGRGLVFLLLFLPVVGLPAAIVNFVMTVWWWIMLPVRALGWLFGLGRARPAG